MSSELATYFHSHTAHLTIFFFEIYSLSSDCFPSLNRQHNNPYSQHIEWFDSIFANHFYDLVKQEYHALGIICIGVAVVCSSMSLRVSSMLLRTNSCKFCPNDSPHRPHLLSSLLCSELFFLLIFFWQIFFYRNLFLKCQFQIFFSHSKRTNFVKNIQNNNDCQYKRRLCFTIFFSVMCLWLRQTKCVLVWVSEWSVYIVQRHRIRVLLSSLLSGNIFFFFFGKLFIIMQYKMSISNILFF